MTPEAPEAVRGVVISSLPLALTLDALLLLLLAAGRYFLFVAILRLITRDTAHRSWKRMLTILVCIGALYAVLNTTGTLIDSAKAILTVSLLCGLLMKRLCWIDVDKALTVSFLYCILSAGIGAGLGLGLDRLIHERQTIDRVLAAKVDAYTRALTKVPDLPPSRGVFAAMQRYSASSEGSGGVVDTLLAPARAAQKAQKKIKEVNEIATEQAKLVNMLSGAGTNVTSRKDELKALHEGLTATPGADTAAAVPDIMTTTDAPPAAPAATVKAAEAAKPAPPTPPPAPAVTPVVTAAVVKITATSTNAARPAAHPGATGQVDGDAARLAIKVTGVGHSAGSSYVLIGSEFVRVGEVHRTTYNGRPYTFRLIAIDWQDRCQWEQVDDAAATNAAAPSLRL